MHHGAEIGEAVAAGRGEGGEPLRMCMHTPHWLRRQRDHPLESGSLGSRTVAHPTNQPIDLSTTNRTCGSVRVDAGELSFVCR